MLDVDKLKSDIPLFKNNPNLVYLDSGATSLKPRYVLDKMEEYYREYGVNIHRGVYELSYRATKEFDDARTKIAKFINARFEEVIFTRGTTNSLNMIAQTYGYANIYPGDEIITSELEHHSSLLPWMQVAKKKNANLKYIPLDKSGRITLEGFKQVLSEKTKVVAITYVSNVMGYKTPIKEIIKLAHQYGAIVIVDAAQAVPHFKIDVKDLDCDFLAFSSHKMLGPTGIGILYGKLEHLKDMDPEEFGGDMNDEVFLDDVKVKKSPFKFEAGTPPIAEAIGLGAAIDLIENIGYENIAAHEKHLHQYLLKRLDNIRGVTIYNKDADIAILNFNIDGVHPHDASTFFDEANIALRAGHHCAQLVSKWLKCNGTLRASFYIYNNENDVDIFIETLKKTIDFFKQFNEVVG